MMRKMWFGTKKFARWIKVHSPGSTYTASGHSARIDYLNGGVGLRRSLSGHEELQLTWNRLTSQEAREISDFAYGTYGDGPFYLSDPGAQRLNVLNKQWSMPGLTGKDGVPLAGKKRPELVANPDQSHGYPVDMAKYPVNETTPRRSFYVPIPPGHTAWVGVHGDENSSAGVEVQPTVSGVPMGNPSVVPVIGVDTVQRVTHSFPAGGDQAGIELSLEAAGSVTNLFTNPNLVGTGGTVNIYENLFTNPSFEAGSGAVEVRRNLFPDPLFVSTPSGTGPGGVWTIYQRCSVETNGDGSATVERVTTGGNCGPGSGNVVVVTPGQVVTISALVSNVSDWARVRCIGLNNAANADVGSQVVGNSVTSVGWSTATITIPEGADRLNFQLQVSSALGDKANFSQVLIEIAGERHEFFAPGLPSPDSDLAPSWTGAANASESVLVGLSAESFTLIGDGKAYLSSGWSASGSTSLKMVGSPINNSSQRIVSDLFSVTPGELYTVMGTINMPDGIGGIGGYPRSLQIRDSTGAILGDSGPVSAGGVTNVRYTFTPTAANIRFWLDMRSSSGTWFWDNLAVVKGDYTGPWFDGDHPLDDPDFTTEWTGTANASKTLVTGEPVAGMSTSNCLAIRSSKFGGSMRLIATNPGSSASYAYRSIPVGAVRDDGTIMATLHLEAPLTGATSSNALSIRAQSPAQSVSGVNEAGSQPLRYHYEGLTSNYTMWFYHGGRAGSGDVYWTAPGLFEGEYDGPWFSGDSEGAEWDGTPNASSSTRSTSFATIAGMIVQVLPTGTTPEPGDFISGQGMNGADFEGVVRPTPYSFDHDSYGLAVNLVETDDWR